MNDISAKEEEFFARFERFKARMRELRGLRVNQFLGLLEPGQVRKVHLIEKEVEEFVRKFAYGGGISSLLQESILVAFNSDQVMRKRIELQSPETKRGPGVATVRSREERRSTTETPPATGGHNGSRSTGFFTPTPAEIARQARQLMGGKRISGQSLHALHNAIARKMNGNGESRVGEATSKGRVKLSLTDSGKVSILVDEKG